MGKIKVLAKLKQEIDNNYQQFRSEWHLKTFPKGISHKVKKRTKIFSEIFFSQKAIFNGASNDLPYQTLVILGELLSHPGHQEVMQEIIRQNILISKGEYLKLDDPYQQGKIRKALRTFQFEACRDLKTSKAA